MRPDPDGGGSLKHRAQRITYNTAGFATRLETGTVNSQSDGDWASFAALEQVDVAHDGDGRPVRQALISGSTTYAVTDLSYDSAGRPLCGATRMNPSAWGTVTTACTAQSAGANGPDRIVRNSYDAAGRVTLVQTGYGVSGEQANEVATTYRNNGQVETATDAEGNMTTYVHDGHDRLSRTRMPSPTTDGVSSTTDYEELTYDAASNVTVRRLRDGQTIAFAYDNLNRMTARDVPNVQWWESDIVYSYDNLGRTVTASDSMGHVFTFAYDSLGRLVSEVSNWTGGTYSQYDLAGRRTRLTHVDGLYFTYDYLVTGEMSAVRENGAASGIGVLATYAYDDRGRRTSLTRGNGTVTSYGYDNVSRRTGLAHDFAGTTHDLTLGFTYNPASQIASSTRSNDAFAWTAHYGVNRGYTANGLNQYTASGAVTPGYDARGNLISAGGATYAYTAENRMVTSPGGDYNYDPLGRLFMRTATSSFFRHDGGAIITEQDNSSGATRRRYVHGAGVDEPLVWYEGTWTYDRRWLHADERGSIVAVSDDSGAVTAINRYDEYGLPQGPSGAGTLAGQFGYTGQIWLPENGMYYYKARMYSPTLGRMMQTDPIGYGDGMNSYSYVGNDPVNLTDPTGTSRLGLWGSICGVGDSCTINGMDVDVIGMTLAQAFSKMLAEKAADFSEGRCLYDPLVCALWADSDVQAQMRRAWRNSNYYLADSLRREWGFWITPVNGDFIAHELIEGDGPRIEAPMRHQPDQNAYIWFHVHPFSSLDWGLSGLDSILLSRNPITMVIYAGVRQQRHQWLVWESPLRRRQ